MDVRTSLRRYADVARAEILRDHTRQSCIASTWITLEVFRRLALPGRPLPVRVSVGNGAYGRRVSRSGPPRSAEELVKWGEEDGSYIVGVGTEATLGGIGGHLVALIGGQFLVDASLDQATSTEHDLRIPSVMVIELRPEELAPGVIRRIDADIYVEYTLSPAAADYALSPDWGQTAEVVTAVDRILAAMSSGA